MIPNDPAMLVSYLNMKLRDEYGSLSELCEDLGLDADALLAKLAEAGYVYSECGNRFRPQ